MPSKYSDKLREEALKLSDEIGNIAAAEQLNLNKRTLEYWRMMRNREEKKKLEKKLSKVIKPTEIDPAKELKNNSKITFQAADKTPRQFKRGELYYILKDFSCGSEIAKGRPAIIISNDILNTKLHTVEVAFLTTRVKPISQAYTTTHATGVISTVVCDQITTIDKDRVGEYVGRCTPEEMQKVDKAILYSIGLEKYNTELMSDEQVLFRMQKIKSERDVYKEMYDNLFEKITSK